ncbi:MAG TPA: cohesin domain-containing protein, partial [Thermoanaerobaculia bacterium]|nr:cohesin domain-containing protein [Thermoanaerobaculia bacterium]
FWGEVLASYRLASTQMAPVRLALQAPAAALHPGDTISVPLMIEAREAVSHLPMTLRYDPSLLSVVSVTPGGFFGGPERSTLLYDDSTPGRLTFGVSRLGREPGVSGRGEIASITFRARRPGGATVRFQAVKALDGDLNPLAGIIAPPLTLRIERSRSQPPRRRSVGEGNSTA